MALPTHFRSGPSPSALLANAGSVAAGGVGGGALRTIPPVASVAAAAPALTGGENLGDLPEWAGGLSLRSLSAESRQLFVQLCERKLVEFSAEDAVRFRAVLFDNLARMNVEQITSCFRAVHEKAPFAIPQKFQLLKRLGEPGALRLLDEEVLLLMQFSRDTGRPWDDMMNGVLLAYENGECSPTLLHGAVLTAFKTNLTRSKLVENALGLKLQGRLLDETWEVLRAELPLHSSIFADQLSNVVGGSKRWRDGPVALSMEDRLTFLAALAWFPWSGSASIEKLAVSLIEATRRTDTTADLLKQDAALQSMGVVSERYSTRLMIELQKREARTTPAQLQQLLDCTVGLGSVGTQGAGWIAGMLRSVTSSLAQQSLTPNEFSTLSAMLRGNGADTELMVRQGLAAALATAVIEERVVVDTTQLAQFMLRATTLGGFSQQLFGSLDKILSERLRIENQTKEVITPETMLTVAELVARTPQCSNSLCQAAAQKSLIYLRALKPNDAIELLWLWTASGREVSVTMLHECMEQLRQIGQYPDRDPGLYLPAHQCVTGLSHSILKNVSGLFPAAVLPEQVPAIEHEDLATMRCHLRCIEWGGTRHGVSVFLTAQVGGVTVALLPSQGAPRREQKSSESDDVVTTRSRAELTCALQTRILEKAKFQVLSAYVPLESSDSACGAAMAGALREWLYMGDAVEAEVSWQQKEEPRLLEFD